MAIELLPNEVINQIAAGEVVERPAHLVKELVENSIDAGADLIEIEYDEAGRRVRVTDNGRGMDDRDLNLALARHATSKISTTDDLWKLKSFGFRGEALASIAAVSRLSLLSRPQGGESAHRVAAEFGKIEPASVAGGNPGTTIVIEDLFANVPARLKFLKSEGAEHGQIKQTLKALALANPHVEFRLRSRGKVEGIYSRTDSELKRAEQVLGLSRLYENRLAVGDFKVHVIFSSPSEVQGTSRNIWLFVQGRWVQDRSLTAAVMDAYRSLLMHGEFPTVVAKVEVDPAQIDVNIHPAKSQVKFQDASTAFRMLSRTLREGLERAPWQNPQHSGVGESEQKNLGARSMGIQDEVSFASSDLKNESVPKNDARASNDAREPRETLEFSGDSFSQIQFRRSEAFSSEPASPKVTMADLVRSANSRPEQAVGVWSRLQVLAQTNLTYILAQSESALVLIDQHAAHERVAFERLQRAWKLGGLEEQMMLMPITLELDPALVEGLQSRAEDLKKLGFQVDAVGPSTVAVRSYPALLPTEAVEEVLSRFAAEMSEHGGSFSIEKHLGDIFATMACHSVVRAGQAMSREQMEDLLKQMDEFPLSGYCPHGRPVSVEFSFARLERDFGRTQ